jgi:C-terminal processing protease CtpA/Prc
VIAFFAAGLCLIGQAGQAITGDAYARDFEALWTEFRDSYAYIRTKGLDWNAVKRAYTPQFRAVKDRTGFLRLLEKVVEEMRDPHALVLTNDQHSPRLVPSGADIWASWHGREAIIEEIREGSPAQAKGIRPTLRILEWDGRPIRDVVVARLGKVQPRYTSAHLNWALRQVLAGHWSEKRRLTTVDRNGRRHVYALDPMPPYSAKVPLESMRLASNVGYIRLKDSLGNDALIPAFESALRTLIGTRALVLDLRECPSGGNTAVARAIMGRLIDREQPYQRHEVDEPATRTKKVWVEYAPPLGHRPYLKPMVVLVDHWTGSMAEGLATGLAGMRRATTVGTEMAGLAGALGTVEMPNTHIRVGFPTERLYLVNKTPRENYRPEAYVNLLDPKAAASQDPILARGLRILAR